VARRGHAYPNVRVVASDLVNTRLAPLSPPMSAGEALAGATRHDVGGYVVASGRAALRGDLGRAVTLGLGHVAAARLGRPCPVVAAEADEVTVRRALLHGAPLVLVRAGTRFVGGVAPSGAGMPILGPSLAARLAGLLDAGTRRILLRIAQLAEGQGGRAFVAGGVVRDAVAGQARRGARDLDVVIEGDGVAVARRLAGETGGRFAVHSRFLTASVRIDGGTRVDVATARTEHYEAPGALPRVRPAEIAEDLRRRDFTVNAMAVELSSGRFHLVDPLGGQRDLALRRLRILHPLSFVEDPTRLLRAGRYAVRLGLALDPWTAACRQWALELAPFATLSGTRLVAELKLALEEPCPGQVLARLARDGAFRLFAPRYRHTGTAAARLRGLVPALDWARLHAPAAPGVELLVLVLLADQPPEAAADALVRLGVTGSPAARLLAILGRGSAQPPDLAPGRPPSAVARALRGRSELERAWLWLNGNAAVRRRLTRFSARDAAVTPWLTGDEIVALGIPPGPAVGRVLEELRDARLDGALRDRAAATAHVRNRAAPGAHAGDPRGEVGACPGPRSGERARRGGGPPGRHAVVRRAHGAKGGVTWRRNTSS
jgi:tRNA nucleotidyltransferase/poly(A) polymerase